MAAFGQAVDLDLEPLDRRIDKSRGLAGHALLAKHVPGLDSLPQFEAYARMLDNTADRKTELALRLEPGLVEIVTGVFKIVQDLKEVVPDEVLEHVAVVQGRAPAHRLAVQRCAPEGSDQRAQQQLLGEAHARIGRHLERAEFDKAKPAGRAIRRKQFVDAYFGPVGIAGYVDQDIAEQPIDQPR